jgi:ribosome-associated protein
MKQRELQKLALNVLDEMKAEDITELDVRELTDITDVMLICTGRSNRHVKSTADKLMQAAKAADHEVLGHAGEEESEWVLVDLGDVIVHIMQANARELYQLESLWTHAD